MNAKSSNDETALQLAGRNLNTVKYLIQAGADVYCMNKNKITVLHHAARHGNFECVKHLMELLDFDVEGIGRKAYWMFGRFIGKDYSETTSLTPLHFAAEGGHLEIVKYLVAHGANMSAEDWGVTPLHMAAGSGHVDCVRYFLDGRVDPNRPDNVDWSPMHAAAMEGHLTIIRVLLERGAHISPVPIHTAAIHGHSDCVEFFVANGVDVNVRETSDCGGTPLHFAAYAGHRHVVECLVALGADVSAKRLDGGDTAYNVAVKGTFTDCITFLAKCMPPTKI